MLRVIAGNLGGRRLRAPAGLSTRPTADRVREALFNILGPPPPEATVLDLYAGSGALGIESLSRGAARAIFVEQDAQVCRTLAGNLRELKIDARASVLTRPVRAALTLFAAEPRRFYAPFHWIFADPPYASDELPAILTLIEGASLLAPAGCLTIERATRDADAFAASLPDDSALKVIDRRRYGDTTLLFLAYVGEPP